MTPHGKHLLLATSGPEPAAEDRRLLALAGLMGVAAKTIALGENGSLSQQVLDKLDAAPLCLAMSADTLAAINRDAGSGAGLESLLDGRLAQLLVYGCTSAVKHQRALLPLAAGAISGIKALDGQLKRFALPRTAAHFSGMLAGLGFSGSYEEPAFAFALRREASDGDAILTADDRAVFVHFKRKATGVFLIAGALPDIGKQLHRKRGVEHYYGSLVPPIVFLRLCFSQSCWQGPPATARLIIDDPGLSARYGFLDYRVLERSMQLHRYGTSIAFIPWNSWRTTRKKAARLLGADPNLSICIHGCDHTEHEFEAQDPLLLDTLAGLAMRRMEAQQRRTGARFEPVMVFPQGRFSAASIQALRANRYLAAVNTTVFPMDHGPADITIGDLLLPAVTRYNGFPIFMRHYSRNLFDLAFDLYLGKPALLVEHHQFFRKGCAPIEAVAAELHKIAPSLTWPSLTHQLTRSCLLRNLPDGSTPNGSTEVQFFTRSFVLEGREAGSGRFLLRKFEPDSALIREVSVDGIPVPYSIENGFLTLEVDAEPGQSRTIEIADREQVRPAASPLGVAYNTRVLLRRGLSEFRDNTLARNNRVLRAARRFAGVLKGK